MEPRPKHLYKPSKNFFFYLCLFAGIGLFIGSYFILATTFKKEYPQLFEVLLGFAMIGFGLYCFYYYLNRKTIAVFDDGLELQSGFASQKTVIRNNDIQSWAVLEKKGKYNNWEELYIFTASRKYCFVSNDYEDFYGLKAFIAASHTRNETYENKWSYRNISRISYFVLLLGLGFFLAGYYSVVKSDIPLQATAFSKTDQVVASGIKIKKGRKRSKSIALKFQNYPQFTFKIKGNAYRAMYAKDFVSETKIGDTLTLTISKNDFEKKIARTKPLDFWDKHVGYYNIQVVGLSHKNNDYLTLADYETEKNSHHNGLTFGIIGLVIMIAGVFIFVKRKEIAEA